MGSFALKEMKGSVTTWLFVGRRSTVREQEHNSMLRTGRQPCRPTEQLREDVVRYFSKRHVLPQAPRVFMESQPSSYVPSHVWTHGAWKRKKEKETAETETSFPSRARARAAPSHGRVRGWQKGSAGSTEQAAGLRGAARDKDWFCFCFGSFAWIPVRVRFSTAYSQLHPLTAALLGCFGNSDQHLAGLWLIQVACPVLPDLPLASRGHLPRRAHALLLGLQCELPRVNSQDGFAFPREVPWKVVKPLWF